MDTIKTEETLKSVLNETMQTLLPSELKEGELWVRAIAKVLKRNCSYEYVLIEHQYTNGEDSYRITKDFGSMQKVSKLIAIYPYESVNYVPEFKNKSEIVDYLCHELNCDRSEFDGFKKERLVNGVNKILINKYKNNHG